MNESESAEAPAPWPLMRIWVRPRSTIRSQLLSTPIWAVVLWCTMAGVTTTFQNIQASEQPSALPLHTMILLALGLAPIYALLWLGVCAPVTQFASGFFRGRGTLRHMWVGFGWAMVPRMTQSLLWLLAVLVFGDELFSASTAEAGFSSASSVGIRGFLLLDLVITVWGFWVVLACIGEVQKFSTWRAMGAVLVGMLIIAVPLIFLAGLLLVLFRAV